jgi:hypothetical protein
MQSSQSAAFLYASGVTGGFQGVHISALTVLCPIAAWFSGNSAPVDFRRPSVMPKNKIQPKKRMPNN